MHLYFHIPFCARRCTYCDFAIAVRREVPSRAYVDVVLLEWEQWERHSAWEASPTVATVYLGGGTPSLLHPDDVERLLDRVRSDRPVDPGAEITLEANPDDVTPERASRWTSAGVTRVSLGVQSFDPAVLAWMHRTHQADQIFPAVEALRTAGFDAISLDLIFGLPAELGRDWASDLSRAMALGPDHLSVYGLTVEDNTPLAHWVARGAVRPVADERYAEEFLQADRVLTAAGYQHYEVSNFSRPGFRAQHNSAYWRRAPYLGLGPSAHSGFQRQRQWNLREWATYQRAVEGGGEAVAGREVLDAQALRIEELYLGLRTVDGVAPALLPEALLSRWVAAGWLLVERAGAGLHRARLTPEGWLRLDALVAEAA